jgi:hypothetical protein
MIFTHNLHWTEVQFSDFCHEDGSPDGRDVHAGLIEQMIYQRHVGRFLVFPVCGVLFSTQDLRRLVGSYLRTETESSLRNIMF